MIFPFPFIVQTPPLPPRPPFWLHFSDNPKAETDTDETDAIYVLYMLFHSIMYKMTGNLQHCSGEYYLT